MPPEDIPREAVGVPWKPRANPWLIAVVVALAAFMEVLDTSIANVALPYIAGKTDMRPGQLARVYVDTYGRTYDGHVLNIAGASGARYSLWHVCRTGRESPVRRMRRHAAVLTSSRRGAR